MTVVIYTVMSALLLCWLALKVIKARRANQIAYADGGVIELQIARSAHTNAVEYIPITLLLLFGLEYNGGPLWIVHPIGLAFMIGRIIHSRGILTEKLPYRVLGMQITLLVIVALSLLNLIYFPFTQFVQ